MSGIPCLCLLFVLLQTSSIKNDDIISARTLRHEIVHPTKICLDGSCQHVHLSLSTMEGQVYKFELVRNDELLSDDYFEDIDDKVIPQSRSFEEERSCYYHSKKNNVVAAVSLCGGKVEGTFTLENESFILQFDHDLKDHCIFRYHDLPQPDWSGDSSFDLSVAKDYADKYLKRQDTVGRGSKTVIKTVPNVKYLEVLYVVDKAMFVRLKSDVAKTREFVRNIVNQVAIKYRSEDPSDPMNFHIALKGLKIWSEKEPLPGNPNIEFHLVEFLKYNFEILHPTIGHDHVTLISGKTFPDTPYILGIALRTSVCVRAELAGVMAVFHKSHTATSLADTIAHETGHSLGFWDERYKKDWNCNGKNYKTCYDGCPTDDCIMRSCSSPTKKTSSNKWSDCTRTMADSKWRGGWYHCLGNKPFRNTSIDAINVCGNGVVEYGETCDCPINDKHCRDACCNMNNCTLKNGSQCSSGLCCSNCRLLGKGERCREKLDETCDVADTCDGLTEFCVDKYAVTKNKSCGGSNDMWCKMGRCTDKCFKKCFGHGACKEAGEGYECECTGLYYGKFCQFRFGITWHIVLGCILGAISCVITLIVFSLQDKYVIKDQFY